MILDSLKIALESLWSNKMRTLLSMLGVIIGVSAVIAIVSVGSGSTQQITSQISNLGSNMITIYPRSEMARFGMVSSGANTTNDFSLELIDYMEKFCPSVKQVIPVNQGSGLLIYNDINTNATLVGTNTNYPMVNNYELDKGNFFSDADIEEKNNVMVLGSQLAEDIFGSDNPIGQKIKINYQNRIFLFNVVAVMAEKGGGIAGQLDEQAYIPYTTSMKKLSNTDYVSSYIAQANSSEEAEAAVGEITNFLSKVLDDEDQEKFSVSSQDEILDTINSVTDTLSLMLAGIAAISLLVGGIGIMNIMLVSVTERTREIGIRKALGARNQHILSQFLLESLSLSSFGGFIGIIFGCVATYFLAQFGGWPMVISVFPIIAAFGFALFIGVFFGLYPAMKAAKMNPVDALRYE